MIIVTWTVRVICGAAALAAALWASIGIAEWTAGRRDRRHRTVQLAALDAAVARHPGGSKLPGPGQPQPSGAGRDDDTRIGEWTPRELAFLRGEEETPS